MGAENRRTRAVTTVADLLFPRRCAGCDRRGDWLCADCARTLHPLYPVGCPRCGVPRIHGTCSCRTLHPAIERAISPYPYTGWVANAIRRLKYERESARAQDLGQHLIEPVRALGPLDGIVPVPLHPRKYRERGFNQTELLGRVVSDALNVPILPMIQRTRHTTAQMTLGANDRRQNVAHAFMFAGESVVPDGRYVLIDDVRTTGSTLGACAEAMAAGGIAHVLVATLTVDLDAERLDVLRHRGLIRDRAARLPNQT